MLNWWLGRPAGDAKRGDYENDAPDALDVPETPAPVFAARAIKSAIFGTPAWREENEFERPRGPINATNRSSIPNQREDEMSPTKPQGILLTPGTSTTRRKTVSFGSGVVDNELKNAIGKSGIPNNCPGKFPSPWTPNVGPNFAPSRRTALLKTLEAARDENADTHSKAKSVEVKAQLDLKSESKVTDPEPEAPVTDEFETKGPEQDVDDDEFDGDTTTDLNYPHSQSGRYWKSEYQKYHEDVLAQMKKLVKYKQLAKSYARKKDSEAVDLAGKLRDEQQKVANMESKISELVAQIAHRRLQDSTDESPELMKDLARQTAIAVQYKDQVDQFQSALLERDALAQQESSSTNRKLTSPRTTQTLVETSKELKRAREQVAEMGSLRNDIHSLRLNLTAAEKKAFKLQEENARLSKDLTRVNEELDRSEKCRQDVEAQNQKQDILIQTIQKEYSTLKELAKSQRRDAEQLLRKRHEQVAGLKQEILSLKLQGNGISSTKPREAAARHPSGSKKPSEVKELEVELVKNLNSDAEDLIIFDETPKPARRSSISQGKRVMAAEDGGAPHPTNGSNPQSSIDKHHENPRTAAYERQVDIHSLESKIPAIVGSAENGRKMRMHDSNRLPIDAGRRNNRRSQQPALAEIINDADADRSPARNNAAIQDQLSPGFQERFSNLSLSSPGPVEPSLGPSSAYGPPPPSKRLRDIASPRPSMFTFPSSPPKQAHRQARSSVIDPSKNVRSSRLSSMVSSRTRTELPPDRAAAAKARLQQKLAERKRGQEMGDQENVKI